MHRLPTSAPTRSSFRISDSFFSEILLYYHISIFFSYSGTILAVHRARNQECMMSIASDAYRDATAETADIEQHKVSPKWILLSAVLGSVIEWYDFYIFGTAAALVFGQLFFPATDPFVATISSLLTVTVGLFARPVGSILFGHFGDRIGRKSMLLLTLFLMGIPTALIGMLPTYQSVGVWAPIMLIVLRIIQGLAIGGEWGGAVLMAVEHASHDRKSVFGSLPQLGTPAGVLLSVGAFALASRMPEGEFVAWGWRIPFLTSIALVAFGLAVRWKISESPEFMMAREENRIHRVPIVELFRQRTKSVILTAGGKVGEVTMFYLITVYLLSYGTSVLGLPRPEILSIVVTGALVSVIMMPMWGYVGDLVGPKKIYLTGAILLATSAIPMFLLFETRSIWWMAFAVVLTFGIIYPMMYGPQPSLYSVQFPPELRYSGVSLGVSLASAVAGGLAPVVATSLVAASGNAIPVGVYLAAATLISTISVSFMVNPRKP
ncbi:MFS transporter [Bradyrhizobium sp. STM 3843]|uniref:MFS transporter n=1 Tax=Bradyrhizobium sp. STM 3843 TaxID=551947 RepID=UPI001111A0AB|nr:MFS transporter [Bradyrhizobium sp. STM 3843]